MDSGFSLDARENVSRARDAHWELTRSLDASTGLWGRHVDFFFFFWRGKFDDRVVRFGAGFSRLLLLFSLLVSLHRQEGAYSRRAVAHSKR